MKDVWKWLRAEATLVNRLLNMGETDDEPADLSRMEVINVTAAVLALMACTMFVGFVEGLG